MGNWWLISYLTFLNSGGFLKSRKSHLQGFHQKNKWDQIPTDSWGTRAIRYSGWTLFPFSGSECWWFLGMILLMRTPKYPTLINPPPLPLAYSPYFGKSPRINKKTKEIKKKKRITWIFRFHLDFSWFIGFIRWLWKHWMIYFCWKPLIFHSVKRFVPGGIAEGSRGRTSDPHGMDLQFWRFFNGFPENVQIPVFLA